MTYDEYFAILEEKYGDGFNWVWTSADSFAAELFQSFYTALQIVESLNPEINTASVSYFCRG